MLFTGGLWYVLNHQSISNTTSGCLSQIVHSGSEYVNNLWITGHLTTNWLLCFSVIINIKTQHECFY